MLGYHPIKPDNGLKGGYNPYSHPYKDNLLKGCSTYYKPINSEAQPVVFHYDPSVAVRRDQLRGISVPQPNTSNSDDNRTVVLVKCEVKNHRENIAVRFMSIGILKGVLAELLDVKKWMQASITRFKQLLKLTIH